MSNHGKHLSMAHHHNNGSAIVTASS